MPTVSIYLSIYLSRCYTLNPCVNDLDGEKEQPHHNVTTYMEFKCGFLSFLDLECYFLRKVFLVLDATIRGNDVSRQTKTLALKTGK